MRPTPLAALLLAALAGPAAAQAPWTVRPDGSARPTEVRIESRPPGWRLTSGPASIIYRPADSATGTYTLTARLQLLPGTGAHQEAFGVFIGGRDLGAAGQRYSYFLVRGDGSWKVKLRRGAAVSDVAGDWHRSPAIVAARPDGPATNLLGVVVSADKVRFLVNGTEVWSGERKALETNGVSGIRLNHNLSVVLEAFGVKRP